MFKPIKIDDVSPSLKEWANHGQQENNLCLLLIFVTAIRYSISKTNISASDLSDRFTPNEYSVFLEILKCNQALLFQADKTTPRTFSQGIKSHEEINLLRRAHHVFKLALKPFNLLPSTLESILPPIVADTGGVPKLSDSVFIAAKNPKSAKIKEALLEDISEDDLAACIQWLKLSDEEKKKQKLPTIKGKLLPQEFIEKIGSLKVPPPDIKFELFELHDTGLSDSVFDVLLKARQESDPSNLKKIATTSTKLNVLGIAAANGTPEIFDRIYEATKQQGISWKGSTGEEEVSSDGWTPFHCAIAFSNTILIDHFFKILNSRKSTGYIPNIHASTPNSKSTLLHLAALMNNVKTVEKLITAGVKINEKNHEGHTALYLAVYANNKEVVGLLINAGANLDEQNIKGDTALH